MPGNFKILFKPIVTVTIWIILLVVTFLFVGVYHDPEFSSDVSLFTKYRPAARFDFKDYCEGDIRELTPVMQREDNAYHEFIIEHKPFDASLFIIQATLTFLTLGFNSIKKNTIVTLPQIGLHIIVCILPTLAGLGFIMHPYKLTSTILILSLIFLFNFFIAYIQTKAKFDQIQIRESAEPGD